MKFKGKALQGATEEILTLVGVAAEVIYKEEMGWTKF